MIAVKYFPPYQLMRWQLPLARSHMQWLFREARARICCRAGHFPHLSHIGPSSDSYFFLRWLVRASNVCLLFYRIHSALTERLMGTTLKVILLGGAPTIQ
jgi:hypothetical protein